MTRATDRKRQLLARNGAIEALRHVTDTHIEPADRLDPVTPIW
jgi:hypothetical protein